MNRLERLADGASPSLSVHLRSLKKRLHGDLDYALLSQFVHAGDAVIDAGANRGVYAYRLARLVGRSGSVFAAEPVPQNVRVLQCIFAKHQNVTIWPIALSDRCGSAEFHVPIFNDTQIDALASLQKPLVDHSTVVVPLDRLDSLIPSALQVSFIKCDVEGNEQAVIRGAERLLRDSYPTLLVEIEQRHHREDIRDVFSAILDLGYIGYFIEHEEIRPLAEFDVDRHQLRFLGEAFVPYSMPTGYVNDFVFVHPRRWPRWSGISRRPVCL